ncbi:YneF family protein [Paenibacillus sp. P96]|uniref:YneF family protein n=1 Tax=Paenibacillus zeirhizosphaerae TaxID=2987519 RepID=A0ABT9FLM8_9BACL|nr:YneF family protein [Paenibacillus sp. P96]MDP4095625.1 YneF family protein [Paenibacillus sp. P96]
MVWNIVIPIVTLILGLVGGFFIGVYYLRKQLEKMQSDPEALQKMAKQMGYNLNGKQMQRAQQMMKNQQFSKNQPGTRRNQGRRK